MRILIPDLMPGTNYAIQVRTVRNGDVSEWSPRFELLTDQNLTAPRTPTAVTWEVSGDSFIGSWDSVTTDVSGEAATVTGYEVELVAGGITKLVTVGQNTADRVTYTLPLSDNKALFSGIARPQITMRVRAVNNKDIKSLWSSANIAINPAPEAPVSATTNSGIDGFTVEWEASVSDDVVKYHVYSSGAGANFTPTLANRIGTVSAPSTSFSYTTATYAVHYLRVYSVDAFGQESTEFAAAQATPQSPFIRDITPPDAPTGVSVSSGYDHSKHSPYLDISWSANTEDDLAEYTVRYGASASGPWETMRLDKDATSTRIFVAPGTYHVGLNARDWDANASEYTSATGSPISTAADTLAPKAPTGLSAVVQGSSFIATWTPVTQNTDNSPINDLKHYEVGVKNGSTEVFYTLPDSQFTFGLDQNRMAFTTPRSSVIFRVRAVDQSGNASAWSAEQSVSAGTISPPTALTGKGGANAITISWTESTHTDVVGYNIYQGNAANPTTKAGFVRANIFSTTITTTAGQFFSVRAVDSFGRESASLSGGPWSATNPFLVDTTAPAVPSSLAATVTNNSNGIGARASLTWTNGSETDRAGIEVSYKRSTDSVWSSTIFGKDATSGVIELPAAYAAYNFRIRAYDRSANYSAWSSTVNASAPANTAPGNVTGLAGTSTANSITYRWDALADEDIKGYEITFSTSSTFASGNTTYMAGNTNTLTVSGLNSNTNYYARIRAVDTAGLTSASWSSTNTTKTKTYNSALTDGVAPASSPTPVLTSRIGSIYANWPAASNADPVTYEVHLSTTSGFTPSAGTMVTETPGTFAPIETTPNGTPLSHGVTYYVRLVAKDADGKAPVGAQASGTISKVTGDDTDLNPEDVGAPSTDEFDDLAGKVDASVKSYVIEYALNSSETVPPTSGWSTETPVRAPGAFIWTRTVITYQDNSTTTSNPALLTGNTGAQGDPGQNATERYTWVRYADTPTTGMSATPTGKTYMGIAYNKTSATPSSNYSDYSWSLIKGADGSDGKGISNTEVKYAKSAVGDTPPEEGPLWVNSVPATSPGEFLWTRTVTTYTDSTKSTAYSVAAHGATGPTGSAGRGVSGTTVEYAKSTQGTNPATVSGWQSGIPTTNPGEFLWTRTTTTYTSGSPTISHSVARHGQTGQQGVPGPPGEDGQPTYTWIKYAPNGSPTAAQMTDDPAGMTYIGIAHNKNTQVESTTPTDYKWALIQGPQGPAGQDGADAPIVTLTATAQALISPPGGGATTPATATITGSAVNTTIPNTTTGWQYSVDGAAFSGTVPAGVSRSGNIVTITGATMTARTIAVKAAGGGTSDTITIAKVSDGAKGDTGNTGAPGSDGVGVSGTTVTYQVSSNATTPPTGTWHSTVQSTSPGQYLWTRTVTTYTDGSSNIANPAYSVAKHGSTGATGNPGADGRSLTGTTVTYGVSNSGTTQPSSWSETVPSTSPGQFLWTKTTTTYSSAPTSVDSFSVAKHGETGAAGKDAYTVLMTNEAMVFAGSTSAALAGEETTSIIAYKGATQQTATVGTITGQVSGLTTEVTNNGTNAPVIKVKVTTSLTAQTGVLTVPVTVDGKVFNKTVSWSVSRKGATGSTGGTGPQGVSVTAITPYYARVAASASAPTQPTTQATPPSPWTATEPGYLFDTKMYRTDRISYSNGTYSWTTVVESSAYQAAVTAIDTADGKNKIIFSTSTPSGTNYKAGDIWYRKSGSDIIGVWEFTTSWQSRTLRDEVLDSLSAGKLVSGSISTAAITLASSGKIESQNYDSAASGFRLTSGGIEIKGAPLTISNVSGLASDLSSKETPAGAQAKADAARQAAVDAAKVADAVTGGGDAKSFHNVLNITKKVNNAPGSIVITTPITFTSKMTRLTIEGYNYLTGQTDIHTVVGFYAYNASSWFLQTSQTNYGSKQVSIRLATRDSDNTVAIIIDSVVGNWHYPNIRVSRVEIGYTEAPDSWATTGWSGDLLTDLTGYTPRITPPIQDFTDAYGKTMYWNFTGTTKIDGGAIQADTVDAVQIKAGAISVEKMRVGSLDNLITDPTFIAPLGDSWTSAPDASITNNGRNGGRVITFSNTSAQQASYNLPYDYISVEAGQRYRLSAWVRNVGAAIPAAAVAIGARFKRVDGTLAWAAVSNQTTMAAGTWHRVDGIVTAPENTASMSVYVASQSALSSGTLYIESPTINRALGGELIVDGAIEAQHVDANVFTGKNFYVGDGGTIQSTLFTASQGFQLSSSGLIIRSGEVSATVIRSGDIGGPAGINSVLNVAENTTLVTNGGAIRSNTYGSNAYNAAATAGYFISDGHFHVVKGQIKANALVSDTLTSTTIKLGSGGVIESNGYTGSGSGFRLTANGLDIPNGSINIAKVNITNGSISGDAITSISGDKITTGSIKSNNYHATNKTGWIINTNGSAEFSNLNVWGDTTVGSGTANYIRSAGGSTSAGWFLRGDGKLFAQDVDIRGKITATSGTIGGTTITSTTLTGGIIQTSSSNLGIKLDNTNGIRGYNTSGAVVFHVMANGNTEIGGTTTLKGTTILNDTLTLGGTMTTSGNIVFSGSGKITAGGWQISSSGISIPNGAINVGSINITNDSIPGAAITTIDGGKIQTGVIQSSQTETVNGVARKKWSVDLDGIAQFAGMNIYGNVVVGDGPEDQDTVIQSSNYMEGESGWILRGDGTGALLNLDAGSISANVLTSGSLTDSITIANSGTILARNEDSGARVGISGTEGFFVDGPDSEGNPAYVHFPLDGAPNIISGNLDANVLTVADATVKDKSVVDVGASLILNNTPNLPPPPTVQARYPSLTMAGSEDSVDLGSNFTYYSGHFYRLVKVNSAQARLIQYDPNTGAQKSYRNIAYGLTNVKGIKSLIVYSYTTSGTTVTGFHIKFLVLETNSQGLGVVKVMKATNTTYPATVMEMGLYDPWIASGQFQATAIIGDGTTGFVVAHAWKSTSGWRTLQLSRRTDAGALVSGSEINTNLGFDANPKINSVLHTNGDFGSIRYVLDIGGWSEIIVINASGIVQTNENFPKPPINSFGTGWDSVNNKFYSYSIDNATNGSRVARIYRYTGPTWTTQSSRWAVAYSRGTSSNHIPISQVTYINMPKRAALHVTFDRAGMSQVRVWVGRGAGDVPTSQMYHQGTFTGTGSTAQIDTITFSGQTAAANKPPDFPPDPGSIAVIKSTATDTDSGSTQDSIRIQSDGSARIRNLTAHNLSVTGAISNGLLPVRMASGTVVLYTVAGDGAGSVGIINFPAGRFTKTPKIVITAKNTTSPDYLVLIVGTPSVNGFSARTRRFDGTAGSVFGVACDWIAVQEDD